MTEANYVMYRSSPWSGERSTTKLRHYNVENGILYGVTGDGREIAVREWFHVVEMAEEHVGGIDDG